jgi:hypothetical protein
MEKIEPSTLEEISDAKTKEILTTNQVEDLILGKTQPPKETVNHPEHYGGDTTYEAIKVVEAWRLDFCLGNAAKYICRAGRKGNELEDLQKAAWYINRRIQQIEGKV